MTEQHDRRDDWPSELRRPEHSSRALGAPVCHGHDWPSELRRPEPPSTSEPTFDEVELWESAIPDDAPGLASIECQVSTLRRILGIVRRHLDCTNLSHAEAARIFTEAREMREERDAALAELELARRVVAMLRGRTLAVRGDELCIYATADDVAAIHRALAPTTGGAAGEGP